jgi:hypothetical protein
MKYIIFNIAFVFLIVPVIPVFSQVYRNTNATVNFYSHTPLEDIEAVSDEANSIIDISKNQLAFSVKNKSFKFKNSLMEEHFNEKYMESETYPASSFAGAINEKIPFSTEGEYQITVTGKLNIHGVSVIRTIPGIITVQKEKIVLKSEFTVKTADHKIDIPKLVFEKIAEQIKVTVNSTLLMK